VVLEHGSLLATKPATWRGLPSNLVAATILRVIAKEQVMPLLLEACPSFREPREVYVAEPEYEDDLLYLHLGEFARHLVGLMKAGATEEFPAVFDLVENLHLDGDAYVKEAATIGLLEGIQFQAGYQGVDPERFVPFFKPVSARWWKEWLEFWDGRHPVRRVRPARGNTVTAGPLLASYRQWPAEASSSR
jgi:hypothetical protein